jgi:hypothetical protein
VARLISRNRTNTKINKKRHKYAHQRKRKEQVVDTATLKGYTCSKPKTYKYIMGNLFVEQCLPLSQMPMGAIPYYGPNSKNKMRDTNVVHYQTRLNGDIVGKTTMNIGHNHEFTIKKDKSVIIHNAYHPQNKNIYHNHEYVGKYPNGHVVGNQSACYPNCRDKYGIDGAKPHSHDLLTDIINGKIY